MVGNFSRDVSQVEEDVEGGKVSHEATATTVSEMRDIWLYTRLEITWLEVFTIFSSVKSVKGAYHASRLLRELVSLDKLT